MFGIEHTEFNICPNLQAPCPLLLAQGAVVLNLGGISVPTSPLQNQWLEELTVHAQNNILPHLERISCECYSVIKIEVDRLLPRDFFARNAETADFFIDAPCGVARVTAQD